MSVPVAARAGRLDAAARLRALFADDAPRPVPGVPAEAGDSAVLCARGQVNGVDAYAFATEPARMGGALGSEGCARIVGTIMAAARTAVPVVGIWHSGGARLPDGVIALDGVGRVFRAIVAASRHIPQISVVLGPAAGGAAYGPALTDVVVMSGSGRIFVTGPDVVRSVTGQQADAVMLGGPEVHSRHSGVAHLVADDDEAAIAVGRRLVDLFGRPAAPGPAGAVPAPDPAGAVPAPGPAGAVPALDPGTLLPARARQAYDVRPLVRSLLDEPGLELRPRWAANMVTVLGRLAGRTVGVLANNPLRKGGCLDSLSAEKAATFVDMCDARRVPLVVVVDVPGYLPGVNEEWNGVVRRGAKLLRAFSEATVPRVTLLTRKAYGGAYIAMNSRALGATAVFAWPTAEVAVMDATAAVSVLHRRRLVACPAGEREQLLSALIRSHQEQAGGVGRAAQAGLVDEIIPPALTRCRIAEALAAAARAAALGR